MQVVKVPDPLLTQKSTPVTKFDKKLKKLVNEMTATLAAARDPEGVGLAAPQVGLLKRLFVMQLNPDSPKQKPRFAAFINPEIIDQQTMHREKTSEMTNFSRRRLFDPDVHRGSSSPRKISSPRGLEQDNQVLEGCLSIDNVWGFPQRASKIKIRYQDVSGKKHTQTFTGFPAAIIQHEIDHLNGVLFTHRALQQGKNLYQIEKDEETKEPVLVPLEL